MLILPPISLIFPPRIGITFWKSGHLILARPLLRLLVIKCTVKLIFQNKFPYLCFFPKTYQIQWLLLYSLMVGVFLYDINSWLYIVVLLSRRYSKQLSWNDALFGNFSTFTILICKIQYLRESFGLRRLKLLIAMNSSYLEVVPKRWDASFCLAPTLTIWASSWVS